MVRTLIDRGLPPIGRTCLFCRTRKEFADGSSTSTAYDGAGHAVQAVDELGHVAWMAYDAAGRLTSSTNALGATTRNVYDAAGNTVSRIDPLGHTESYAYDAGNRVVATIFADGRAESTAYDAAGRASVRTDALGRSTLYAYDYLGHLVSVTDALGQLTQYSYDERGAKTAQVDARNDRTGFLYDFVTGVETARFLPDSSIERRAVDATGQVVLRTDFMGQTTSYAYDLRGRVLSRTYPDGSVVSFTYTPTGRRATMTDALGTTSYGYDSRDRVVQMTYPDGRALAYGYDAHGNRTSLTAKVGGTSLGTTTGYDAANRPNRITDPLARSFALAYDADGNRTELQAPNTTSTTYAYDARNRLMSLSTVQGTSANPVLSVAYTLDDAGRRTQVTEGDGTLRAYAYDGIDRLTGETVTGALSYAKTFAYDPVGNRRTQTTTGAGAATVNYTYDTRDRLTTETGTSYAYDANGNVTSKSGEAVYAWDFENRLTGANMTAGPAVAHQYDADGNRVQTSVTASGGSAATTNMLVDTVGCASCGGGLSQVVAETDGTGNLIAVYVRSQDELLKLMRPGSTPGMWTSRFVHGDGLGSVRVLTDESGTISNTRAYEAFGTKNTEAGSDPLTYGFAGEPFQAESQLAYHRARWMDARVGRFGGMDQVDGQNERPMTMHRYVYGTNRPTTVTDPSGNDGVDSEVNFATLFRTGPPALGPAAKYQGNGTYPEYDMALDAALSDAINRSHATTTLKFKGDGVGQESPTMYAEYGGWIYEIAGTTNIYWSYQVGTSGDGGEVSMDEDINTFNTIPAGGHVVTGFHTHPNNGGGYTFSSGAPFSTCASQFSAQDRQGQWVVWNNWNLPDVDFYIRTQGKRLHWGAGFSVPDDITASAGYTPCASSW